MSSSVTRTLTGHLVPPSSAENGSKLTVGRGLPGSAVYVLTFSELGLMEGWRRGDLFCFFFSPFIKLLGRAGPNICGPGMVR